MKLLKRQFKVWYPKFKGPIEPDLTIMLMACARELLTTWETLKDKELITRHLASMDKLYGPGAEQRVRDYMHEIKNTERGL
jgi:hypothetical protein